MKLLLVVILFGLRSLGSFGQSKRTTDPFPTYQQIKPIDSEIIDYVAEQGTVERSSRQHPVNLFNYPPKTVTYVLNGKSTTDVKFVKSLLSKKEILIDTITIEQASDNGKRIIRINYSTQLQTEQPEIR
ncbi:hypothetical protein [Spirosoma validum]|uniref:DUF4138 domain-containing protein n=1 Tax=Spirosoma validum TaxID=2771355 RepID=A0A927B5H5_9BACT|nr:hypothetical protein [Spirosoma validum]MBD2755713.1 hypothetical protein [Spirosoma validum]